MTGYVYSFKDSSILIGPITTKSKLRKEVFASDIENLKIRKKNSVFKGIIIGAASGLVTGILIGHAISDEKGYAPSKSNSSYLDLREYTVAVTGTTGTIAGGIIGGIIGGMRVKIPINRKTSTYQTEVKNFLMQ